MGKVNNLPVPLRGGAGVTQFNPEEALKREAQANTVKEYARAIKDWDTLKDAVKQQIEDQHQLVAWWDEVVPPAGGDRQSKKHYPRSGIMLSAKEAATLSGFKIQKISKFRKGIESGEEYEVKLFGPSYAEAMGKLKASELVQQSTSNEHYTPAKYIEAARLVLGTIDLDPASCKEANKTVKATEFFDKKKDGLSQEWHGKIWFNPPYGDLVGKFIAKLMVELEAGHVTEVIVLVNAHGTDTLWFQPLWDGCLCFTDHRINFMGGGTRSGSTHGSVFVYFGPDKRLFKKQFSQFGAVVERV